MIETIVAKFRESIEDIAHTIVEDVIRKELSTRLTDILQPATTSKTAPKVSRPTTVKSNVWDNSSKWNDLSSGSVWSRARDGKTLYYEWQGWNAARDRLIFYPLTRLKRDNSFVRHWSTHTEDHKTVSLSPSCFRSKLRLVRRQR